MKIEDCITGQRVTQKESGKPATIRRIYGSSSEVELSFDNGSTARMHVRLVEPAASLEAGASDPGPMRACPQCAAKMPATTHLCPACGFAYGVKPAKPPFSPMRYLTALVLLLAIGYAIWKWVFRG